MIQTRLMLAFATLLVVACAGHLNELTPTIVVRGHVVDAATNQPLRWVSVTFPNMKTGTTTDSAGAFEFRAPRPSAGRVQLVLRFIGYEHSEMSVRAVRDSIQDIGIISLQPRPVQVDDLIVTSPNRKPR